MKTQTYLAKLMITLLIATTLWIGWLIKDILLLFFIAFILAAAIKPAAEKMNKSYKIPLSISILLIFLSLVVFAGFFIYLVIPPLVSEIIALAKVFTKSLGLQEFRLDWLIPQRTTNFVDQLRGYEEIFVRYGQTATTLLVLIQSTLTGVILAFTVFVVTFNMLVSYPSLVNLVSYAFPRQVTNRRQAAEKMMTRLIDRLGAWVRGRAFVMMIIGMCTYVALVLMGVPYALALALIATMLEIIPHFGPIIAAIPAILVATFLVSPLTGILVAIYYTLLQQIESGIITPQVMKHAIHVQPLVTIFLVLIGLHIMGIAGGVLSLPLYILLKIIFQELIPHYSEWFRKNS